MIAARRPVAAVAAVISEATMAHRSSGVITDWYIRLKVAASFTGMLNPLASTVSGYETIVERVRRSAASTACFKRSRNSAARVGLGGGAGVCAATAAKAAATIIAVVAGRRNLVVLFL